jgi:hypothetical protein
MRQNTNPPCFDDRAHLLAWVEEDRHGLVPGEYHPLPYKELTLDEFWALADASGEKNKSRWKKWIPIPTEFDLNLDIDALIDKNKKKKKTQMATYLTLDVEEQTQMATYLRYEQPTQLNNDWRATPANLAWQSVVDEDQAG